MEAVPPTRLRRTATRTARSALGPIPSLSSTTASTTVSQSTQKPVRSSPPGTLPCARAMSDALVLAAAEEVEAVLAPLLAVVAQSLVLSVRAHLVLLALLWVVVVLPVLAVEAAPLHLLSRQSFSAAMARS